MRREVQPPAGAASTCARCYRAGIISADQSRNDSHGKTTQLLIGTIRFECVCGNAWLTDKTEALAQGRFVQRLDAWRDNPGGQA